LNLIIWEDARDNSVADGLKQLSGGNTEHHIIEHSAITATLSETLPTLRANFLTAWDEECHAHTRLNFHRYFAQFTLNPTPFTLLRLFFRDTDHPPGHPAFSEART
jgi:hypothetical protein